MRILIVDKQPLYRQALAINLTALFADAHLFELSHIAEVQGLFALNTIFDLIIVEVSPGLLLSFEWLQQFKQLMPNAIILTIAEQLSIENARELIRHGVQACLLKTASIEEMRQAFKLVVLQEYYLSPTIFLEKRPKNSLEHINVIQGGQLNALSPRQKEVFALVAQGLSNKVIAKQLNCAEGTAKLHVSAILKQLKLKKRSDIILAKLQD